MKGNEGVGREPAFPAQDVGVHGTHGMTLRDYFAAKAMAAMIGIDPKGSDLPEGMDAVQFVAIGAYEVADAMLAARAEDAPQP